MHDCLFNNTHINTLIMVFLRDKLHVYADVKFAYAIMNKKNPNNFSVITNKPDWFSLYIQNNYQYIDPVLLTALHTLTPFAWDENIKISLGLKMTRIFGVAKNHNITNGYTFILHDQFDNLVVLSLIMDADCNEELKKKITENKNYIQMLLIITHERLIKFYQEINESERKDKCLSKDIFSCRENQVLHWASLGKSYQEIAIILGIKLTTVKYHINNIIRKLSVNNAKHAIRLAIELRLIRPILPEIK